MTAAPTYEPVIGLEIHVQLKTQTKMFCGCRVSFGEAPNTHTCPTCLGLPGALPVINERAVQFGVMIGLAFGCEIVAFDPMPSAEAVAAMDALIRGGRADALLYNSQAVSPITTQVRAAAQHAGIPVVAVTETLPPHLSFQQWQLGQVRSLERALAR